MKLLTAQSFASRYGFKLGEQSLRSALGQLLGKVYPSLTSMTQLKKKQLGEFGERNLTRKDSR